MAKTRYLRYVVGSGQISPTDEKILVVGSSHRPVTKKNVQVLLGLTKLTGYCLKFIPNYKVITGGSGRSYQEKVPSSSGVDLKQVLCSYPVLANP